MGIETSEIDVEAITQRYLERLRSKDPSHRQRAAVKLWGSVHRADVREALTLRMRDRDVHTRISAISAVASLADEDETVREAVMTRIRKERDPRVWRAMVLCLAAALKEDDELASTAKGRARAEGKRFDDALREALGTMWPDG